MLKFKGNKFVRRNFLSISILLFSYWIERKEENIFLRTGFMNLNIILYFSHILFCCFDFVVCMNMISCLVVIFTKLVTVRSVCLSYKASMYQH